MQRRHEKRPVHLPRLNKGMWDDHRRPGYHHGRPCPAQ